MQPLAGLEQMAQDAFAQRFINRIHCSLPLKFY
jgi:hypothetical protein